MKKFSALDIVIIAVLLLVILFGFLKIKNKIVAGATEQTVRFSVLSTEADTGTGDIISVGDRVSISLKEKAYATVVGVEETEHFEYEFSPNLKKYVSQSIEGKADIILELECTANISDTEILNGNVPIRVGEESYIHGKGYSLHGYIVTVDEVQNEQEAVK